MSKGYTCYKLTDATREDLLNLLRPHYTKVIAKHITIEWNVESTTPVKAPEKVLLIGYARIDGLACAVVSVNGEEFRAKGVPYHITLSLDPKRFQPFQSNALLKEHGFYRFQSSEFYLELEVEPMFWDFEKKAFFQATIA